MKNAFSSENINWLWRAAIIQFFILFLFIVSLTNLSHLLGFKSGPYLFLICVFYWSIYRPSMIPLIVSFLLGVIQDLVYEYPVGLHAILYTSFSVALRHQRIFLMGQTYLILWLFFALCCLVYGFLEWSFFSIRYWDFFDLGPLISSVLITIFLYPLMNWLFILLHRMLSSVSSIEN